MKKTLRKFIFFLKKNFRRFEIIIVESGSSDKSLYICKKVEKKYRNLKLIVEKKEMDLEQL